MESRGAVRGRTPKAWMRPEEEALMVRSSVLMRRAQGADSWAGRKSSQGLARLRIEVVMWWVFMKERMCGTEEYSGPMGRPRRDGGVDGLADGLSEGRIMRRGGGGGVSGEGGGSWRSWGGEVREERREM